jgi:alcohol dehydrogenase class IV
VVWGEGALDGLGEELRGAGAQRVLLLTTASLVREGGLLRRVESALGPLPFERFAGLAAHVPADGVRAAVERYRQFGADAIVTFGGGSVIDAGKALAGVLVDEGERSPYHVALPTTLSGSEFSHYYGVTGEPAPDGAGGPVLFKKSHAREETTPAAVFLDPRLTAATPDKLWSSTAIKALDHAVEGLLSPGERPITDALALLGIRNMSVALPRSLDPAAPEARLACQLAAWECYFAPASTGLGLSHRIGHVLGGTFGVPHGLTSCVTLVPVMRAMAGVTPGELYLIADALSPKRLLDVESPGTSDPTEAAGRLESLVASLGLPTRLRDLGIVRGDVPRIAALVSGSYPEAVARLGEDADAGFAFLMESMW